MGRLHFEAGEKLDTNTYFSPSELSTLTKIGELQDINDGTESIQMAFDISQGLIDEARQSLLSVEEEAAFFGLSDTFQLPQEYTTELIGILGSSERIRNELRDFSVFNVTEYDQNSDEQMVFISVNTNNVAYNEPYLIGTEIDHTARDGDTYPYYLVSREGQLFYYPEGVKASIFPGDQLLIPRSLESDFPIPLVEPFIAEELINPLLSLGGVGRDLGHFVLGAVYQYFINQGEFPRTLLSLDPVIREWFEATEAEAEAGLPDTSAFQAGRLFGDGASVVTGAIEFIAGLDQAFRGLQAGISGCALTAGSACAPSLAIAGAAVAGGALRSAQGLYSAAAGIENLVEAVFAVSAGDGLGDSTEPISGDPARQGFDVDTTIESSLRPSREGSEEARAVQSLRKKIDRRDPAYSEFEVTQEDANQIIEEVLGSSNQDAVIRVGTNRNGENYTDIFNPDTGRGVRMIDGIFDTFVNF